VNRTTTHLHIIDALGPFCLPRDDDIINWSKVPFSHLEQNSRLSTTTRQRIVERFKIYITRVHAIGYDSISVDDLAHLADFPFYTDQTRQLLDDYRHLYKQLFALAKAQHIRIFINTDYAFYNSEIATHLNETGHSTEEFFQKVIDKALHDFPEIDGIILRIGEHDGKDVSSTFKSHIKLQTPRQARRLLRTILPIFEAHQKLLVFRTWTVGVYKIGDLIWNKRTFDAIFSSITSEALIISMKFGDTDFMRYLTLNPLFFHSSHKKIIELQTRREWEGMGTYPSFVGWEYEQYIEKLKNTASIIGIHVWCQTGGWAKKGWSNVTYLDESSFWNELNTEVTIAIFKDKRDVKTAVEIFCAHRSIANPKKFLELLRLSDTAIKKGLYIPELAERCFYLRRTRLPTLLWLSWDIVTTQPSMIHMLRLLLRQPQDAIAASEEAIRAVSDMSLLAKQLKLSKDVQASLQFQYDTFYLFLRLRRYMFNHATPQELHILQSDVAHYTAMYPQHYTIAHLRPLRRGQYIPKQSLGLFLRTVAPYRKRDRIALSTSVLQRSLVRYYLRRSRSHLAHQSMGLDILFE